MQPANPLGTGPTAVHPLFPNTPNVNVMVNPVCKEDWHVNFIKFALLEMLRRKGYSKFEEHALRIFADTILEATKKLMANTASLSNLCLRNESNLVDVISVLFSQGAKLDQLQDFIKQKTELQERMREKGNKVYANSLSKLILNELTPQEPYLCKRGLSDLNRAQSKQDGYQGHFFKVKVLSNYPLKMIQRDKEKDFMLELCPPPELALTTAQQVEDDKLNSHDVKNLKAEEKRNYELENCKISAIAEEQNAIEGPLRERESTGKNPIDVVSRQLEKINIMEISNSQMF